MASNVLKRYNIASEESIFKYFFQKFSLLVAMKTNQIERFGYKVYIWWRTTQQIFPKVFSEIAINANFHFSQFKSMENLSCHSNESTCAMAIQNTIFIEASVMNISEKL